MKVTEAKIILGITQGGLTSIKALVRVPTHLNKYFADRFVRNRIQLLKRLN